VKGTDFEVKKEAAWALSNCTSGGSLDQISLLVDRGIVEPMCELIVSSDTKLVSVALECIDNILKNGDLVKNKTHSSANPYCVKVESCGGLDNLEKLQSHNSNEIYEKAVAILETYFGAEEDQNIAPNHAANTFQFGSTNNSAMNFSF